MRKLYRCIALMQLLILGKNTFGQRGLNSIYSAYGIGDYKMRDPNIYTGMGGASVAMPSQLSINETNPASFAWLPKDNFNLEIGFGGLSTKYFNERVNTPAADLTISRIAVSAQLVNPIRTVFGLRRFSQVEYYTNAERRIDGSDKQIGSTIEGNGGLYQAYLGNAIKIGKGLAIGLNAGLIFGSINRQETISLIDENPIIVDENSFYSKASANLGLQYQFKTNKIKWSMGAFYEPQIKLNVFKETQLLNQEGQVTLSKDPIKEKFIYPQKFGAGAAFTVHSFTLSADVIGHLWEQTGYKDEHFTTTDAYSYSIGFRHQFSRNSLWNQTAPGISIYGGFNRELSYLIINDKQIASNAITFGTTFPNKRNLNYYSVGAKVGSRGRAEYPIVREDFFEFNFVLTLGSFFQKERKYY